RKQGGKTGIAGFFLGTAQVLASFKVPELVFDQDHFEADGKVFVGVGLCVESKGGAPRARLGRRKVVHSRGGCNRIRAGGGRTLQASLTIKGVMEVEPKSTVKFKNRKGHGRRLILGRRCGHEKERGNEHN